MKYFSWFMTGFSAVQLSIYISRHELWGVVGWAVVLILWVYNVRNYSK